MPKTTNIYAFFLCVLSLLHLGASPAHRNSPPEGFVRLSDLIETIKVDARYHTPNNFTGAPLPGYGVPDAWLLDEPAQALQRVQQQLAAQGLGLLVYDAYRPKRGTKAMAAWAERTGQVDLINKGYIARHSGHNHGHTIDLTLIRLKTGEILDMGTPWDTLSPASHTKNATGDALNNRLLLKRAMEAEGFKYYYKEWWHFRYVMSDTRPRDVPYSCFEAPEGHWTPPKNWTDPSFAPPMNWTDKDCLPNSSP